MTDPKESGTLFAHKSKVLRCDKTALREEMKALWDSLCDHQARRDFVNGYMCATGDVGELTYTIGQKFLRQVLDENIELLKSGRIY